MEKKITRKENFATLLDIVNASTIDSKDMLVEFIEKEMSTIDSRAEKAKARAAAKKVAGDAMREAVRAVLTSELQTADEITSKVTGEDITKSKVIARLTQLVKAGIATKEDVKNSDNKTVKAYKLV